MTMWQEEKRAQIAQCYESGKRHHALLTGMVTPTPAEAQEMQELQREVAQFTEEEFHELCQDSAKRSAGEMVDRQAGRPAGAWFWHEPIGCYEIWTKDMGQYRGPASGEILSEIEFHLCYKKVR